MPAVSKAARSAPVQRHAIRSALSFAFLGALLSTACSHAVPPAQSLLNLRAPDFALTTLDGKPLRLSAFRGKVVLLNFWATWCAPCQIEMPEFARWQRELGPSGLQVIGISMDDDPAPARRLVERFSLGYPVAMGDERIGTRYGGVLGLPLTFLIDRDGIVRARFQGETDLHAIESRVKALLAPAQ
ncbi:MAG: TlpA disulfide reductase family protein [Terracidiphilus sp.]